MLEGINAAGICLHADIGDVENIAYVDGHCHRVIKSLDLQIGNNGKK